FPYTDRVGDFSSGASVTQSAIQGSYARRICLAEARVEHRGMGVTARRDAWWLELVPVIALLGGFGVYATLRAFEGAHYEWGPYLSPFYSPLIDPGHRWLPRFLSPAL